MPTAKNLSPKMKAALLKVAQLPPAQRRGVARHARKMLELAIAAKAST